MVARRFIDYSNQQCERERGGTWNFKQREKKKKKKEKKMWLVDWWGGGGHFCKFMLFIDWLMGKL